MKEILYTTLLCTLLLGCAGATTKTANTSTVTSSSVSAPAKAKEYSYIVEKIYPHSTSSYTQGLLYVDGQLWEGTGLNGESRILKVDLETGKTKEFSSLAQRDFGEGITIVGDTLFQLTWTSNRAYFYSLKSGEKIGEKLYAGEGWGITTDGDKLYMSDGTPRITVRNHSTFNVERSFTVRYNGESVPYLNELEWINGKIWANVYTTNQIVMINPQNGEVEGVIDLTGILPEEEFTDTTDVLNGIAYDKEGDRIFVTGKNWSKLFEIKIVEK